MKNMSSTIDALNQSVEVGDFVFAHSYFYEVRAVSKNAVKAMIHPASRTSKVKKIYQNDFVKVDKHQYLLKLITKNG